MSRFGVRKWGAVVISRSRSSSSRRRRRSSSSSRRYLEPNNWAIIAQVLGKLVAEVAQIVRVSLFWPPQPSSRAFILQKVNVTDLYAGAAMMRKQLQALNVWSANMYFH